MDPHELDAPRLAVYGTLRPGHPNHHVVADIAGHWFEGHIHGRLLDEGWGAALGSPGLVLDDHADAVSVWVLESSDLPSHWARLDEFEGPGYRRAPVLVRMGDGEVAASIYVLASE